MKKKFFAMVMAGVMAVSVLAGCGSNNADTSNASASGAGSGSESVQTFKIGTIGPLSGGEGPGQPGGGVQEIPDGRGYPLPLRRQADAAPASLQQGEADLLFETVHHVGEARLGVAQDLRRPGEAPQVHRHHQGFQFLALHRVLAFRHSLPRDIHDIFS